MTLPVFVHPALAGAAPGSQVVLDGDEARHAVVVKRIRAGERVVLTDGAGTAVVGTVAATDKTGGLTAPPPSVDTSASPLPKTDPAPPVADNTPPTTHEGKKPTGGKPIVAQPNPAPPKPPTGGPIVFQPNPVTSVKPPSNPPPTPPPTTKPNKPDQIGY